MTTPPYILRLLIRERTLEDADWEVLVEYQRQQLFNLPHLQFRFLGTLNCCPAPEQQRLRNLFPVSSVVIEPGLIPDGRSPYEMSGLFFWTSVTNHLPELPPSLMETGTLNVWGLTHDRKWVLAEITVRAMSAAAQRTGAGDYQEIKALAIGASCPAEIARLVYGNGYEGIIHDLHEAVQAQTLELNRKAEAAKTVAASSQALVDMLKMIRSR